MIARDGYAPVIIIGAPRSGTNMLRDLLASMPGCRTWPCDEINFIWKHGNLLHPDDELSESQASPRIAKFVRRRFHLLATSSHADFIVEKTCANSLRVGFVAKILPSAKFVFLVRDGRDAIASAIKRWEKPVPGFEYYASKLWHVPFADMPFVILKATTNRAHNLLRASNREWNVWGPVFRDLHRVLEARTLPEICALQWTHCVRRADDALKRIGPSNVCAVKYEEFVSRPCDELTRIAEFLRVPLSGNDSAALSARVSRGHIGKWRTDLDERTVDLIEPIIEDSLVHFGYEN